MLGKANDEHWFIQNQWNDESKQEVQEGMELNLKILSDIAAQYQTSAPKNVHVINVYQALTDGCRRIGTPMRNPA